MNTSERFWAKVDIGAAGECWPWKGGISKNGYGVFWLDGHSVGAHRMAWELVNGPMPVGMQGNHHCDNRACCNPGHLYPGTQRENQQDCVDRGRKVSAPPHGSRQPNAKLSEVDAVEIRRKYAAGLVSEAELGETFGVSRSTIEDVIAGKRWRHTLPPDFQRPERRRGYKRRRQAIH